MFIKALNKEAKGIVIQKRPDGLIVLKGLPMSRRKKTVHDRIMSRVREATTDQPGAVQLLEKLIIGGDAEFMLEPIDNFNSGKIEGSVTFSLSNTKAFNRMNIAITFGVPEDLQYDIYLKDMSDNTLVEAQLDREGRELEDSLSGNQLDLGIPLDDIKDPKDNRDSEEIKKHRSGLDYTIKVDLRQLLLALIKAL